jgi:lipoprotein NlpD
VVQPGDTLFRIAFSNQVTVDELVAWNGIADRNLIKVGQVLKVSDASATAATSSVPTTTASTSSATSTSQASAPESTPAAIVDNQSGVVSQGIGESPESSQLLVTDVPAQSETAPSTANIAPSQNSESSGASTASVNSEAASPTSPTLPDEATQPAPDNAVVVSTPGVTAPNNATAPSSARGIWAWPARGKLISTFVAGDQTRSGLRVSGNEGDAVFAAADGEVIFSGTGITGYGELIVVQHSGGMLSAYGHNRTRKVKEGDKVKRGQVISEMGRDLTGRNGLHFEIRQNGKPVDPLKYLPSDRG